MTIPRHASPDGPKHLHTLAITTSTGVNGIWLRSAGGFDAGVHWQPGRGDRGGGVEGGLTGAIWRLCAEAGLAVADLQRIACDVGPGTFTGLRLGLATARTLAWAWRLPTCAVGSLEALCAEVRAAGHLGPVAVALPARIGVAYVGWSGHPGHWCEAVVADADAAAFCRDRLQATVAQAQSLALAGSAFGIGAGVDQATPLRTAVDQALHGGLSFVAGPANPSARTFLSLAELPHAAWHDALHLAPRYLAASEAEIRGGHFVPETAVVAERR